MREHEQAAESEADWNTRASHDGSSVTCDVGFNQNREGPGAPPERSRRRRIATTTARSGQPPTAC